MNVVLDANIIISALRFEGKPRELLDLCAQGEIGGFVSEVAISEIEEVLRAKFKLTPEEWTHVCSSLEDSLTIVPIVKLPLLPELRDKADLHVLAAAEISQAGYIVSGDKDLLTLGEYKGVPIIAVAEFLRLF